MGGCNSFQAHEKPTVYFFVSYSKHSIEIERVSDPILCIDKFVDALGEATVL